MVIKNGENLSPEMKLAIQKYLAKFASFIGIANIAILSSGLAFVFYTVPDNVARSVKNDVQSSIEIDLINYRARIKEAEVDAGVVNKLTVEQFGRIKSVESEIKKLEDQIIAINSSPSGVNLDALSELSKTKDLNQLLAKVNGFEKFIDRMTTSRNLSSPILPHPGYWGEWQESPKLCAIGEYVCGIKVKFEGRQGKDDDTALNAVELSCCTFSGTTNI